MNEQEFDFQMYKNILKEYDYLVQFVTERNFTENSSLLLEAGKGEEAFLSHLIEFSKVLTK